MEPPKPVATKAAQKINPVPPKVAPKVAAPKPVKREIKTNDEPVASNSKPTRVEIPSKTEDSKPSEVVSVPESSKTEDLKPAPLEKEVVTEAASPLEKEELAVELKIEPVCETLETKVTETMETKPTELLETNKESPTPNTRHEILQEMKLETSTVTENVVPVVTEPVVTENVVPVVTEPAVTETGGLEEKEIGPVSPTRVITTTWVLDRGVRPSRVALLKNLCVENGLTWSASTKNIVQVEGQVKDFSKILGCSFNEYAFPDRGKGIRANNVHMLKNVGHIFGLDTCAGLKHTNLFKPNAIEPRASTFTPLQVAEIYQFPTGDGSGQKIGIVSLGGGYLRSDITTYLTSLGVSIDALSLTDVPVDGATNDPGSDAGADMENALDIEIIASLCPAANIRVYFAPNLNNGFYNAFLKAYQEGCSVISCSWGARESAFGSTNLDAFNALFQTIAQAGGTTIFAASGDTGSSDGGSGVNVDFPASSPYVVGCGGTTLTATGTTIDSEVVWNVNPTTSATGGGLSAHFSVPTYQSSNSSYPFEGKRGVPDVAGNANPNTGYQIYTAATGTQIVGGTSAVSPLWSALMARVKQIVAAQGLPAIGFIHPVIYQATTTAFNDILVGNNGSYTAVSEWDACTGNGSPIGTNILGLFASPNIVTASFTSSPSVGETPLTVQFTDTSIGSPTSWTWTFGDETGSDLQNPSHEFVNPDSGTEKKFTVTLTTNGSSAEHVIAVTNNVQNDTGLPAWGIALIVIAVLVVIALFAFWYSQTKSTPARFAAYSMPAGFTQ